MTKKGKIGEKRGGGLRLWLMGTGQISNEEFKGKSTRDLDHEPLGGVQKGGGERSSRTPRLKQGRGFSFGVSGKRGGRHAFAERGCTIQTIQKKGGGV